MTEQLKRWFEQEPWRSGRELLEKLQAERPGENPDGLIRTVQRRLKIWRSDHARALVFAHSSMLPKTTAVTGLPTMTKVDGVLLRSAYGSTAQDPINAGIDQVAETA